MAGTPKTMNFIVDSKLELIALCTEDRSILQSTLGIGLLIGTAGLHITKVPSTQGYLTEEGALIG